MADTKITQPATEYNNVITTQPQLNAWNTAGNKVLEDATATISLELETDVITTQPGTMSDPNETEQNLQKKFSQFNPTKNLPLPLPSENGAQQQTNDDCTWCCLACTDCGNDVEFCIDCAECCADCCNDSGDTGCCDGGSPDLDGDDVAGCLECCANCDDS